MLTEITKCRTAPFERTFGGCYLLVGVPRPCTRNPLSDLKRLANARHQTNGLKRPQTFWKLQFILRYQKQSQARWTLNRVCQERHNTLTTSDNRSHNNRMRLRLFVERAHLINILPQLLPKHVGPQSFVWLQIMRRLTGIIDASDLTGISRLGFFLHVHVAGGCSVQLSTFFPFLLNYIRVFRAFDASNSFAYDWRSGSG